VKNIGIYEEYRNIGKIGIKEDIGTGLIKIIYDDREPD